MLIEKILSIPKSLYVCLRLFPFWEAIKLPILCRYNVKCLSLKGRVLNKSKLKTKVILIGFGSVGILDKTYERTILQIDGILEISGKTFIGQGARVCIGPHGKVRLGENFINTAGMTLVCVNSVVLGNDVMVSWDTLIMDTDWHSVYDTKSQVILPKTGEITVGNAVWICTRVVLLKGAEIANGCIIGANSLVTKKFSRECVLIAGNPAIERKNDVTKFKD